MFANLPKMLVRRRWVLACLMCCAVVATGAGSEASADPPPESHMTVGATGAAMVVPDVATLSFQVNSSAPTALAARSKANGRTERVLAAIVRLGVDRQDIQTTDVSLDHYLAGRRGHQHRVYTASNSFDVTARRVSLAGPIVDAATAAGVDSFSGVQFSFSNPNAGKAQATRSALANARARGDDAAAAIGYRITEVRSVTIDSQSTAQPQAAYAPATSQPTAQQRRPRPPTPIRPGRQEVDATVTVVYVMVPAS